MEKRRSPLALAWRQLEQKMVYSPEISGLPESGTCALAMEALLGDGSWLEELLFNKAAPSHDRASPSLRSMSWFDGAGSTAPAGRERPRGWFSRRRRGPPRGSDSECALRVLDVGSGGGYMTALLGRWVAMWERRLQASQAEKSAESAAAAQSRRCPSPPRPG